jgi:hypothetical protein
MKINLAKVKAVSFTEARVKKRSRYYFGNQSWKQVALNI